MPRHIDPYSLSLFLSTVREGSIARAAAAQHIAPSALSRRLAELERAIGTALLVRTPKGVELTEAGHVAFRGGNRIANGLQALVQEVLAATGEICGTVRLFANASAVVGFLPERLQAFSKAYPGVQIELQERLSGEVLRACLDGRADVGVSASADLPAALESWHFAEDPLMVVMPAGHPLARLRAVGFARVLEHPLVCIQSGGALDQLLRDRAAEQRLPLEVRVFVNSFDGLCRMVEAGLGIAIVPTSAASAYAGTRRFVRRALDERWAGRELKLYAPRKSPRLRTVAALIDALKG